MGSVAGSSIPDDSEMCRWYSSVAGDSEIVSVVGSLLAGELHW